MRSYDLTSKCGRYGYPIKHLPMDRLALVSLVWLSKHHALNSDLQVVLIPFHNSVVFECGKS